MSLIFSTTEMIFDEHDCSIERFDAVFNQCCVENPDGFFLLSVGDEKVYLFIVAGRPYVSGSIEDGVRSTSSVQEFFNIYSGIKKGRLSYFKADKKLLRGIVVYFQKQSTQRFTPDVVDMERVIGSLESREVDSLIVTTSGNKIGVSLCLKGRPAFNYLPDGNHVGEQPKDALLVYIFHEKDRPFYIDIFEDLKLSAAEDALSPKEPLPGSLMEHYSKVVEPEELTPEVRAELALVSGGKVIRKYEISKTETTIGRTTGNDIFIENPTVSRLHAAIKIEDGKFFIEDRESSNGTFVNDEKITRKELAVGDKVRIVNSIFVFSIPQPEEEKEDLSEKTLYLDASMMKGKKTGVSKLILDDNTEHVLKNSITTIGTGKEMEIKLKGLLIASHQASILKGRDGEYTIVHKGGLTATKINGDKIESQRLKDGDVISIGSYKIGYSVE